MEDLKWDLPATEEVELPAEVLAGINRGTKDADEDRTVSLEEAMEMIPKWISKFESQKRR
jgi:predicted transcriptional regulator